VEKEAYCADDVDDDEAEDDESDDEDDHADAEEEPLKLTGELKPRPNLRADIPG
jgi:hypothetical protein